MQKLKKILSVCFLLLFIFPFAEKGIHDYFHVDASQCTHADKHFHASEHHCELCDFTNNFNVLPSFDHNNLLHNEPAPSRFTFAENNILLYQKEFHFLRAPPSLV